MYTATRLERDELYDSIFEDSMPDIERMQLRTKCAMENRNSIECN
jgi:hypothetical protein